MRLASYLIAGLLTSFAMPALAGNVAVADSQAAIMATETAKKTFEKLTFFYGIYVIYNLV